MSRGKRSGMVAIALALATNMAAAASLPANDGDKAPAAPSAAGLVKFYPTPLSSTPIGVVEDQEVWLAKVQGLIAGAPPLLQQSMLSSRSKQEFSANVTLLQQMQKGSLDEGAVAVKSLAKDGKLGTKGLDVNSPLGSGNGDLVYTALSPCRIMDSRTGGGGLSNPLVGNRLYSIPGFTSTNWGLYGGDSGSNCGLSNSVGSNIWAVALVITILNPNFDAYLGVSDSSTLSTVLSTVALNYTHNQGLSTVYIVPQTLGNTIYFAMPAALTANIIFDVIGYFAVSEATALDCSQVNSGDVIVPNNTPTNVTVACPAGFTLTGGGFYINEGSLGVVNDWLWTNFPVSSNTWQSNYSNQTGGDRHGRSYAICCRVPGR